MRQIAEWLAKIGLERYTPAFIDNDIDVEVLRYLTDADLEKIGVSLGHRRKLLAAIVELIVGEPGLGKSRLIEEFHGRLRDTPHTWLDRGSFCSFWQNTPLHPIARMGPTAVRWRGRIRRAAPGRPGEYADADQAQSGGKRPLAGAAARHSAAAGTRADLSAGRVA